MPRPTVNITCQISIRSYSLETMEQTLRNANESECQRCFRCESSLYKALKMAFTKGASIHPCVSTPQEKSTKDFDLTLVSTFDEMASSPPAWLILVDTCFWKRLHMKVSQEHTGTSRYVKVIVCFNKGQLKNLKHLSNRDVLRNSSEKSWSIKI